MVLLSPLLMKNTYTIYLPVFYSFKVFAVVVCATCRDLTAHRGIFKDELTEPAGERELFECDVRVFKHIYSRPPLHYILILMIVFENSGSLIASVDYYMFS